MKIELYSVPNDIHGRAIKLFLQKNNISFQEFITEDLKVLEEVLRIPVSEKISVIKITYSHSISVMQGFSEDYLNQQIIEHIKRYKIK